MNYIRSVPFIKSTVSALTISIALTGCAVAPDYVAPRLELAPFHNAIDAAIEEETAAPQLDQWWLGFNDPLLVTIIQRALSENLNIAAAVARVDQARAMALGAGAQLLPAADFNASAAAQKQSLNGFIATIAGDSPGFRRNIQSVAIGPSASWELDLFGGRRHSASAFVNEAEAVEADRAGIQIVVAADVADAYFQVRGYQARLAIAERQIETDEQLVGLVQRRYEAGAAQGLEVAQADALLKSALATVPPLRIALEQQLNRLEVLMGSQPGTYAHELQQVQDIPNIPAIPGDAQPLEVLRRRPDIIAAERRLAATNERIGAAISGYYPKISLSGALGFDSLSGGSLFTSDAVQAVGGIGLRWRLFDFGRVDAEVAQSQGANVEALLFYRQSVLRAAEDVENAFMTFSQTQLHVVQLQDQVQALVRARNLSELAYRAGSIALLDVLDADRQLLSARDELDANRATVARAAVGVFRALGGGWNPQIAAQN